MKKIIISIFALSLIFPIVATDGSSNSVRAKFAQEMYLRSGGLLPKKEYEELVNPFLDRAEKELKSVQFCEQNPKCVECKDYFRTLLDYNVVCFHNYVQNNQRTAFLLERRKTNLKYTIRALAKKGALQKSEVEKELQKTEELFLEGNKKFYSASPLRIKALLWFFNK